MCSFILSSVFKYLLHLELPCPQQKLCSLLSHLEITWGSNVVLSFQQSLAGRQTSLTKHSRTGFQTPSALPEKNPLLYARLSPGDQWCWVRPELSTVKVLCTPAIPPHPQILWNLGIFYFFFSFPPEHCHQTLLILPQLKAQRHLSFLHHSHIISTCKRPQIQL